MAEEPPSQVKCFKLNNDGTLDEIPQVEVSKAFQSINILFFYIRRSKRLYLWIGQNASQKLRQHIPKAEHIILKDHPDFTILRHFTVEQNSETQDFYSDTEVNKEQMKASLKKWKDYQLSIYAEIDDFQTDANNAFLTNNYDKAITNAEEIITLAKQIKNYAIIDQQLQFIEEAKQKKKNFAARKAAQDKVKKLVIELQAKLESKSGEEAYEISNNIKKLYREIIKETPKPSHKGLIEQAENLHQNWREEQEKLRQKELEIKQKSKDLKDKINAYLNAQRVEEVPELLEKLRIITDNSIKTEIKAETSDFIKKSNIRMGQIKELLENKQKIDNLLKDAKLKADHNDFEVALELTNQASNIASEKNIESLKQKIEEEQDTINKSKQEFVKKKELLSKLDAHIEEYTADRKFQAAIMNCEKAIEISNELDDNELIAKYKGKKEDLEADFAEHKRRSEEERQRLLETAKELESIIEVEENVLPQMEEFSVQDLLGDLSTDIDEMANQLGGLLNDHRVEVKEEISSSSIIRSASGEVLEISKNTKVKEVSDEAKGDEDIKSVKFSVDSVLENPFDDMIEEAIIEDIIPYNFEVNEIKLNGEIPSENPEQILTKDGLELKWTINNIEPNQNVAINYDLRKRVSRTIVFPMQDQIKIVKTHSSLQPLNPQGLYDANLQFMNNFEQQIAGVVIEDIVPMLYIYSIKAPDDIPMDRTQEAVGSLIKWRINNVPVNYSNVYRYQLLEIYRFEDLKIRANSLSENAFKVLEEGKIDEALAGYTKIEQLLKDYE